MGPFSKGGADVAKKDEKGATALHWAATNGHESTVEMLLTHQADIEARDIGNQTPLHVAALAGRKDVVQILLTAGAEINSLSLGRLTPLHGSVVGRKGLKGIGSDPGTEEEYRGVVRLLLSNGADVDALDSSKQTPLFFAEKEDVAALLLDYGAKISARSRNGFTPLHAAAFEGRKGVVELFLVRGVDASIRDNSGRTPLQVAASSGHWDIVELLGGDQPRELQSLPPEAATESLSRWDALMTDARKMSGQGNHSLAKLIYSSALKEAETLGPEDPRLAESLHSMAEILRREEDYVKAASLFERALAIREKVLGTGHPDTASTLNGLAAVRYSQGRYEQAELIGDS